jgi:hypothetical protein
LGKLLRCTIAERYEIAPVLAMHRLRSVTKRA